MKKRLTAEKLDEIVRGIRENSPESGWVRDLHSGNLVHPVEYWVSGPTQCWVRPNGSIVVIPGEGYYYPKFFQRLALRRALQRYVDHPE